MKSKNYSEVHKYCDELLNIDVKDIWAMSLKGF